MSRAPITRILVVAAVVVLLLDAALLIVAGVWAERLGLVAVGLASAVAAALVGWSWRRHVRRLAEIDEARKDLRGEVQALGDLTRDRQ